jgi:hypothetical protein
MPQVVLLVSGEDLQSATLVEGLVDDLVNLGHASAEEPLDAIPTIDHVAGAVARVLHHGE